MTIGSRRSLRCGVAGFALVAASTFITGCMSGASDDGLFGFTPGAQLEQIAAEQAAGPPAEAPTETAVGEAPAGEAVVASVEEVPAAEAARTASMVAFAAPNQPNRRAGSSLYESLYTESEARTPVRNVEAGRSERVVVTRTDGAGKPAPDAALPGVDPSSLFEIGQRASVDEEDFLDDIGGSYQTASLSGMARLAPNGFLVQREDIVTNCFDTQLVSLLRQIERRFGEKVVITSGYRSPAHNRRVNGAKASMHMACKAADLHVPGVSGPVVASFVRGLPNRGGVGTYCHTASIHVDVGRKRDWNWACRRRQTPAQSSAG